MDTFDQRLAVARKYLSDFGLGAYCGFGRLPPTELPKILDEHLRAVALVMGVPDVGSVPFANSPCLRLLFGSTVVANTSPPLRCSGICHSANPSAPVATDKKITLSLSVFTDSKIAICL